jgi:hypothetical protein
LSDGVSCFRAIGADENGNHGGRAPALAQAPAAFPSTRTSTSSSPWHCHLAG